MIFGARFRHALSCLCVLTVATVGARAQTPTPAAFEAALTDFRYSDAAAIYGVFAQSRIPRDGKPAPDPMLDGMFGRVQLVSGDVYSAHAFLRRDPTGDSGNPVVRALALGEAKLILGLFEEARKVFRQIASKQTGALRSQALVGQAHAELRIDPAAALVTLSTAAPDDGTGGWRASLVESLAAMLTGDTARARTASDRALQIAGAVPFGEYAVAQTLHLQAALAAAQGDRNRHLALLQPMRSEGTDRSLLSRALVERAPRCGVDGVTEQDFIILTMIRPGVAPIVVPTPVFASRVAILPAFARSLAGLWAHNDARPVGIDAAIMMRCRNTPLRGFQDAALARESAEWSAANHLYGFSLVRRTYKAPSSLGEAGRILDEIEQRTGPNSPLLIAPLVEMSQLSAAEAEDASDIRAQRADAYWRRASSLASTIGWSGDWNTLFAPGATNVDVSALRAFIAKVGPSQAYAAVSALSTRFRIADADMLAILGDLRIRLDSSSDPRTIESIGSAQRDLLRKSGRTSEARASEREAGLAPNICNERTDAPVLSDSGVTDSDFPADAFIAGLSGSTVIEVDIEASGKVTRGRTVIETPPLVFAPATAAAVGRMTFAPLLSDRDKNASCRAFRQSIQWRLPQAQQSDEFTQP